MPTLLSLSAHHRMLSRDLAPLRENLPDNILAFDLQLGTASDTIMLHVMVKGEGIYRHGLDRVFLENHTLSESAEALFNMIWSHVPPPTNMIDASDEYDLAMQAQEAFAKLSPQS